MKRSTKQYIILALIAIAIVILLVIIGSNKSNEFKDYQYIIEDYESIVHVDSGMLEVIKEYLHSNATDELSTEEIDGITEYHQYDDMLIVWFDEYYVSLYFEDGMITSYRKVGMPG